MEETAPHRNNLLLLFLHLDVDPTGGVRGQMAWSSRWSPDLVRFVVGDRCSILSIVCGVLHLCAWMTACGGVSLLRLCQVKMTSLGFGDHGKTPG
jgi:hypothetical protein